MTHLFAIIADDIHTLDTPAEIAAAGQILTQAGLTSAPVLSGGPDNDFPTALTLTADGLTRTCSHCGKSHNTHFQKSCPGCTVDAVEMTDMICGILDPNSREEAIENFENFAEIMGGAIELEAHGSSVEGPSIILTLGGAQYRIAVSRVR